MIKVENPQRNYLKKVILISAFKLLIKYLLPIFDSRNYRISATITIVNVGYNFCNNAQI